MTYFYEKAEEQPTPRSASRCSEDDFRYPGPEAADAARRRSSCSPTAVEAAARTVDEPTPNRLREMIRKVANAIVARRPARRVRPDLRRPRQDPGGVPADPGRACTTTASTIRDSTSDGPKPAPAAAGGSAAVARQRRGDVEIAVVAKQRGVDASPLRCDAAPRSRERLRAAPRRATAPPRVAVCLVGDRRARDAQSQRFRGKDATTDVLSFPARRGRLPTDAPPRRHRDLRSARGRARRARRGTRWPGRSAILAPSRLPAPPRLRSRDGRRQRCCALQRALLARLALGAPTDATDEPPRRHSGSAGAAPRCSCLLDLALSILLLARSPL